MKQRIKSGVGRQGRKKFPVRERKVKMTQKEHRGVKGTEGQHENK